MIDQNGQVLIEIMGGPVGPEGPPNAGVVLTGIANNWPPSSSPAKGDLYIVPDPPPAGAPAWALPGHGAFWNGTTWLDAGLLRGSKGERGEPGPPLNVRGTSTVWPPAAAPAAGDIWQLADQPIIGLPSGFKSGGAAAWDAVASKWVPLEAIRGPAGHSVTVFGPSNTPPATALVSKGDVWLANDPAAFSATFDPSTIVQQPGPPGPQGPAGLSAFDTWRQSTGRLTAPVDDFLASIQGPAGAPGAKGPAGETFKVEGVVANQAALPAAPPRLTVYMTQDTGSLFIYDPLSAAKGPDDYVALGRIAGPAGRPAWLSAPVYDTPNIPPAGQPGQMVYVTTTGHLWGWNDATSAWVDGGRVGGGGIADGTDQGQTLTWDAVNAKWVPTGWVRVPEGTTDGDLLSWDDAQRSWVTTTHELGSESNVDLPADPADAEGSVPVYDYKFSRFDVRRLGVGDLDDGPGNIVANDGELLAWDDTAKKWMPSPPPAGTLVGLADVSMAHHTLAAGEALIYNAASHKWVPGMPAGRLADYSAITLYNLGQPVYHEGRIWRAQKDGTLVEPTIADGAALLLINQTGQLKTPRTPTAIGTAAPTGAPVYGQLYLRWVSDADWDVYIVAVNTTTQALEWRMLTLAKKTVWRHVALPPPDATPSNAILWIYGLPGSTRAPIVNQSDWAPINLGDFLVSLADVDAAKAVNGDILTADGLGRWHAQAPAAYTKAEVDARIGAVVSGLEHGISVQSITNDPPTTPTADEVYIVGTAPTGVFVGNANSLALWNGAAWTFTPPQSKEAHLVEDQAAVYAWNSTTRLWAKVAQGSTAPTGDGLPVGAIVMWPNGSIPANYLELNGSHYDAVAYPDLYRVLGTDTLPDFRDRYVRGALPGHAALTTQDWATGRPRNAFTTDNPGGHTHTFNDPLSDNTASAGNRGIKGDAWGAGEAYLHPMPNVASGANGAHSHTITGGGDNETRPQTIYAVYLIKAKV